MELIDGILYLWYRDKVFFSGAEISMNSNEIYLLSGDSKQRHLLLELLAEVRRMPLHTLHYNVDKKEIVYIPKQLVYYNNMRIKDLLAFYVATRPSFKIEEAKAVFTKCNIPLQSKIILLNKEEKEIVKLIISLSIQGKVYIIDETRISDRYFPHILPLLRKENTSYIYYDFIHKDMPYTKTLHIKNYDTLLIGDKR